VNPNEAEDLKDLNELARAVAVLQTQQNTLTERFEAHERKQNGSLDKIWAELRDISKAVNAAATAATLAATNGRPSWGVSMALTALVGAVSTLAVLLIKN
jgi:hypothetical protein